MGLVLKTGPILVGQHVATPVGTMGESLFDDQTTMSSFRNFNPIVTKFAAKRRS